MKRKLDFEIIYTYEVVLIHDNKIEHRHQNTQEIVEDICTELQKRNFARLWEVVTTTNSTPEYEHTHFQYQMISCNEI
jgi:hypothetical protein